VYHPRIGFFVSNTGASAGTSFTQMTGNGLPAAAKADRYAVKAVPGQDGGVWTALGGSGSAGSDGLYASANYGETFVKLANVQRADHLAFGKVALGSAHPAAVYMYGRANGDSEHWLYRSDDMGATWKIINDAAHRFGSGVRVLEADRQVYGQVYVGPSGRGIQYGRPSQPD
jgi:xyloglucan-specific exo-beta-1,4-glucanase